MDRTIAGAAGFLVGVCVFAWLAGPVLESRFGAEALLAAYGAVALAAAATTYVLLRQFGMGTDRSTTDGAPSESDDTGSNTNDETPDRVLDKELEAIEVNREVRQLQSDSPQTSDQE